MITREEFLKNIWKSYPEAPADAGVCGRVQEIDSNSLSLKDKGQWNFSASLNFPIGILEVHDWVALRIEQGKGQGQVVELTLLAPALESPLVLTSDLQTQEKWFQYIAQVREFFIRKSFSEAQTPTLVACPGTEPFLDFFSTEFAIGKKKKKFYLPTSPELHLKKLLSVGAENIFEIRPCFRNGEISERHHPEFWMLEWYRSFVTLDQILHDCLHLIEFLGGSVSGFQRVSIAQLFERHLKFDLTPQTSFAQLKQLAHKNSLSVDSYEVWDDLFHLIFLEKIEPFLQSDQPLFVEKYPPSQAALARLTTDGWGDRFEIYWKGFELGNAFHELNDPEIQLQRSKKDLQLKKNLGKEVPPLDEQFLKALRSGLPPSSGIALGLERLFMALNGLQNIKGLRPFEFLLD